MLEGLGVDIPALVRNVIYVLRITSQKRSGSRLSQAFLRDTIAELDDSGAIAGFAIPDTEPKSIR